MKFSTLTITAFLALQQQQQVHGHTELRRYLVGIPHHHENPRRLLSDSLPEHSQLETLNLWKHGETHQGHHVAHVMLDGASARLLNEVEGVEYVERDSVVWIPEENKEGNDPLGMNDVYYPNDLDENIGEGSVGLSDHTTSWGLDRIDAPEGRDNDYDPDYDGANVRVYVLDTGSRGDHVDFEDRIEAGKNFAGTSAEYTEIGGNGDNGNVDCHGHGTHVASTVAGRTWGVAKKATIVPVRVMSCVGSGSLSGIIKGIEWAVEDMKNHRDKHGIVSMSLLAGKSTSLNNAVKSAVLNNVAVSIAAGNYARDACNYSPGSEPMVLTVGATDNRDYRSSFSNWGSCVDIFAPGSSIRAASHTSTTGDRSLSGTSMACPIASGVLAQAWSKNMDMNSQQVIEYVKKLAREDILFNVCEGSENKFIQIPKTSDPDTPDAIDGRPGDATDYPWEYVAQGATLAGKYMDWDHEFEIVPETFSENGNEFCMVFHAENTAGQLNKSGVRVAMTSGRPHDGKLEKNSYEGSCYEPYSQWYFLEGSNSNGRATAFEYDKAEATSNSFNLPEGGAWFWVKGEKLDSNAIKVSLGNGDNPGANEIVSHTDTQGPDNLLRMAFTAPPTNTITYSNIYPCGAEGITQAPTVPTPAPTTAAPTAAPTFDPTKYTAERKAKSFTTFLEEWDSGSAGRVCFEFTTTSTKNLMLILSSSMENAISFKDKKTATYMLQVGAKKNSVILAKSARKKSSGKITSIDSKSSGSNQFRVDVESGGSIQLWVNGELVLEYNDPELLPVRYWSFATNGKQEVTFDNISNCSHETRAPTTAAPTYPASHCDDINKKKACRKDRDCTWIGNQCVLDPALSSLWV